MGSLIPPGLPLSQQNNGERSEHPPSPAHSQPRIWDCCEDFLILQDAFKAASGSCLKKDYFIIYTPLGACLPWSWLLPPLDRDPALVYSQMLRNIWSFPAPSGSLYEPRSKRSLFISFVPSGFFPEFPITAEPRLLHLRFEVNRSQPISRVHGFTVKPPSNYRLGILQATLTNTASARCVFSD